MSKGRPGIGFKLNPIQLKELPVKTIKRLKIRGICYWCKEKGANLVKNKYGLFHVDGNRKCFREYFFFKVKPLAERDADQTQ